MPEVMDAPASQPIVAPVTEQTPGGETSVTTSKEEAFNTIGNAFDAIEKSLGLNPEPKKEEKVEKQPVEKKEEKTPEATQTETTPTEEPIPGEQTPKAKAKWGELRKKADQLDRILPEYEKYKTEIEQIKSGKEEEVARLTKELEAIKQERESVEGELYLTRVQATKQYKTTVMEPLKKLVEHATQIATDNDMPPDTLLDLVYRGDRKALADAISGFNEFDRTDVARILRDVKEIEGRRLEIENNAKEAYKTAQSSQENEYKAQMNAVKEQRMGEFKALKPKMEQFLSKLPEDVRPDLTDIGRAVESMHDMPENLRVYSVVAGGIFPKLVDAYTTLASEVEELRSENSSLRNGSPRADKGATATAPQQEKKEEVTSSEELAADIMSKMFPR